MIDLFSLFELTTIATFFGACVVLYLTPGADMMFISASGAAGGPRFGVAAALGVSLGSYVHVILAAIGVAALIQAHPAAYYALRYVGAAYLAWLAIGAWRAGDQLSQAMGATDLRRAFLRGWLTNALNPKVSLFVLAFLPQFADPERGPVWVQILVLGAIFSLGSIPFNMGYGAAAGLVSTWLRRSARLMNRLCAAVFGGLAARLVLG
ncbi:MAG: LysE family translocator [Pseudomonadota bacterium]